MPQYRAVYRDHVSDRNPVREEITFVAHDADAALREALRRDTPSFEFTKLVLIEGDVETDLTDKHLPKP